MKPTKIRAVVCYPGQRALVTEIKNDYLSFCKLVAGDIQLVQLTKGVTLLCNEDGKHRGLPFNRLVPGQAPPMPGIEPIFTITTDKGLMKPGDPGWGAHQIYGTFAIFSTNKRGYVSLPEPVAEGWAAVLSDPLLQRKESNE